MKTVICIAALICSGLHAFAALTQIQKSEHRANHLWMLIGAMAVLAGVVLCLLDCALDWLIALTGFIQIACAALQNGRNSQNVHIGHHVIRMLLFAVLSIGFFFV